MSREKRSAHPADRNAKTMRDVSDIRQPEDFLLTLSDGRRINVRRWPGRGRPLVLLHGLLDCSAGWDEFAKTTHRPCVALDLPGFGASDCPTRPRLSAYAEDVCEALQLMDMTGFTLVGHSLGGAVAAKVAARIPESVSALTLIAPACFAPHPLAEALHVPGMSSVVRAGLPFALANPVTAAAGYAAIVSNGRLPERSLLARLRQQAFTVAPGAKAGIEAIFAAGHSKNPLWKSVSAYKGPVMVLWGARDRLVSPKDLKGVMAAFPHAKSEVWERMGHHPQRERPTELARYIENACCRARRARAESKLATRRARHTTAPVTA